MCVKNYILKGKNIDKTYDMLSEQKELEMRVTENYFGLFSIIVYIYYGSTLMLLAALWFVQEIIKVEVYWKS